MKIEHESDYAARRAAEYPPIADLADALYWKEKGDASQWSAYVAKVDAIKAKYPKPSAAPAAPAAPATPAAAGN
jgi:hypothetical protein